MPLVREFVSREITRELRGELARREVGVAVLAKEIGLYEPEPLLRVLARLPVTKRTELLCREWFAKRHGGLAIHYQSLLDDRRREAAEEGAALVGLDYDEGDAP